LISEYITFPLSMHLTMNSSGVNPNFLLGLYLVTMIGLSLSWVSLFSQFRKHFICPIFKLYSVWHVESLLLYCNGRIVNSIFRKEIDIPPHPTCGWGRILFIIACSNIGYCSTVSIVYIDLFFSINIIRIRNNSFS